MEREIRSQFDRERDRERMLTVRLLQLILLPLVLLLCEDTEELADTPVAAALVSGENSDLGKCSSSPA